MKETPFINYDDDDGGDDDDDDDDDDEGTSPRIN